MKRKLCYLLILICANLLTAQIKTIENMVEFKVANSGAFVDDNNVADGYYLFYQVDKLKKGMREYAIDVLDKNLNDVATKKVIVSKRTMLLDKAFNNEAMMFAFYDYKEKELTLKSFDKKVNAKEDIVIQVDKKIDKNFQMQWKMGGLDALLNPVKNKGFVLINGNSEGKGLGYEVTFYPSNENYTKWSYKFVPEERGIYNITPLAFGKDYIVLIEIKSKKMSIKKEYKTIVLDTNTGEKLFEKPYDKNDPKLMSNSFISESNKVSVLGQYYEPNAKLTKAQSLGLYVDVFNTNGEVEFTKKISWQEDVAKFLPVKDNNKLKDIGFIFFHDILKTNSGEYYAIGEQYKKTVSALGMASAIMGGGNAVTQLTIKDIYIFKFDKDFNLTDVKTYEKGISRVPNLVDYGSPQFSAFIIKALGGFDYIYTQIDKKRDRFYANFIDYERGGKGEKSKLVFKTLIHDEGTLSEDKITLPKKARYFRVYPAKVGHVLLLEYNKKEKKTELHLEKLNIK